MSDVQQTLSPREVKERWEKAQREEAMEQERKYKAAMAKKKKWDKEIERDKPKFLRKVVKEKPLFEDLFGDQLPQEPFTEATKLKMGDVLIMTPQLIPVTSTPKVVTLGVEDRVTNIIWEDAKATYLFTWASVQGTPYFYCMYHEDKPSTWLLDYRGQVPHIVPWTWVAGHFNKEIYGEVGFHIIPKSKGTYDQKTGTIKYNGDAFSDRELQSIGFTPEQIKAFREKCKEEAQNV